MKATAKGNEVNISFLNFCAHLITEYPLQGKFLSKMKGKPVLFYKRLNPLGAG